MLRNGYGGLYKAPTKEERRKQKLREGDIRSSLLILDLKDGKFKIQESKKKARHPINCMF